MNEIHTHSEGIIYKEATGQFNCSSGQCDFKKCCKKYKRPGKKQCKKCPKG